MATPTFDDEVSELEYESSSCDSSESEVERRPILSSTPKTAPPAVRKVTRPFSQRGAL